MSDKLSDALAKYNSMMDHLGGCSDGGCVIKRPAGMHTNGGCRCPKDAMKMQRAMYVANGLRDAVSAFLAASPAPAIPADDPVGMPRALLASLVDDVEEYAGRHSFREREQEVRAREIARARVILAAPAISESEDAVAWQVRRADGRIDGVTIQWEHCTKELYDATLATGRYAGYENGPRCEVRELFVARSTDAGVGT